MTTNRVDKLRLTLTKEQIARYYKAKNWFRMHVNREVNVTSDLYLLERVLADQPFKGSELIALGTDPKDSRHVTIDIFERTY